MQYSNQPPDDSNPGPNSQPEQIGFEGPAPETIHGLPELGAGEHAILTASGDLVIASRCAISAYRVTPQEACRTWTAEVREPVTAMCDSPAGIIAASGGALYRATPNGAEQIARVDGTVRTIAAAGSSVFAVVVREGRSDGSLIEVDPIRAVIRSERSLASADAILSTDPSGTYLGISDGSTFRTMSARPENPCDGQDRQMEPRPTAPQPDDCCCGRKGGDPNSHEGASPNTLPLPVPPRDPCDPGRSGVPTPGGGRVVGDGSGVTAYPPGSMGPWNPCRSHLFFDVAKIDTAGGYFVARDREGRNVAVLSATDLSVVEQFQTRQGSVVLSHPSQPRMLTYNRASKSWKNTVLEAIATSPLETISKGLDPENFQSMTWTGTPLPVLRGERAPAVGQLKVLFIPVLDPGQSFSDADLPKLAAYLQRAAFNNVVLYYRENSFGLLKDIIFHVHGVHAGAGGPVRLKKPINDSYFPEYVGAHVEMVKTGLTFPAAVVFDGRERMTLAVQPQKGGRPATTLNVRFPAIIGSAQHLNFPVQIRFAGTETASIAVKRPNGTKATLNLKFTPKNLDIGKEEEVQTKLGELEGYLDGVIAAAEAAAGIPPRLFTRPAMRRLKQPGPGFGFLVTTISHTVTTGPKLEVSSVTYSGVKDPFGLNSALAGRMTIMATGSQRLQSYLDFVTVIAQEEQNIDYSQRRLADDPVIEVDAAGGKLVSKLFISPEDGGPGATMTLSNLVEMGTLFDTPINVPNSEVTSQRSNTPRDGEAGLDGIINDVFTEVVNRLAPPGQHLNRKKDIENFFKPYQSVMIAVIDPADPAHVQPQEMWSAGPNSRRPGLRAVEGPRTAVFRPNPKDIQFFSNWNLVFAAPPTEYLVMCHELGHAIGLADLYPVTSAAAYRDDVIYMGVWAMMHDHNGRAHHCGYHKRQARWISDNRVSVMERPKEDQTLTREYLLVPVEHWPEDNSLVGASQATFGANLPVVQIVELDLGGDGDVYAMIEARTKGYLFSDALEADPAVLITNCIVWWDERRYAFNGRYRAPVHLLHKPTLLTKAGDSFDLAKGAEFPAKGIKVDIVDRQTVRGVPVFRIKVERKHPREFIDLYFSSADPYYKNPDIYIDWTGDNGPGGKSSDRRPEAARRFPLGQPVDQGEKIYVPNSGSELHWMVARLRNIGNVGAEQVKLNFSICEPPGAGDRGNFKLVQTKTLPKLMPTGRDNPVYVPAEWEVAAGFKGHTCILVEVADYKVPRDDEGVAKATDDVWQANNKAQKNVDQIEPKPNSPYEPVEFDFSVNNSGTGPEVCYLEPEALPYGMRLTVSPKRRKISAGETAIFRCKLELDDTIVDASCRGDHDFRINAWRVTGESAVRWGGVQYKVRPRKRTATDISGYWDTREVEIKGSVTPDPYGGTVRIRLAYTDEFARWVSVDLQPGGTFVYKEKSPGQTGSLLVVALFEGNKYWSESRSPERKITPPPVIR